MKKWLSILILSLILILAFILRTVSLSQVPPGLNRDEAAIGYTAYSLLKTGKDEYGKQWPISFKSFGDWKVPVYFYLAMPFVYTFGLTEFATRFPSAVLGTATVALTFFLVLKLFTHEIEDNQVTTIALLSSLFLAISPWHLFMSRNASESNVAVFLVSCSLILFFKSFQKMYYIIFSFIMLALSLFTYHGNHIFTPLLLILLCTLQWKELRKNKWFLPAVIIFLSMAFLIYSQTLFSADKVKISGLSPLSDAKVYENVVLRRLEYAKPTLFSQVLHNKPLYLFKTVLINYIRGLSPEFLFISGGTNAQHNIPEFGNLYIWEFFVWPIAIYSILAQKRKVSYFLILWLLISPISASITRDAPHTNRMMGILPLPAILTGYGMAILLDWLRRRRLLIVGSVFISALVLGNFIIYLDQYYVHFPFVAAKSWGKGYKEMIDKVVKHKDKYKEVYIARPDYSPYIYYLFYQKSDPLLVQSTMERYPETSEGFSHVKRFDGVNYKKINWTDELMIPNRLYVDWVESIPSGATSSAALITKNELLQLEQRNFDTSEIGIGTVVTSRVIDKVFLPDKTPLFYLIETQVGTPSAEKV